MDKDITLHYIDKLHNSLLESGKALNRNLIVSIIASLVLFGLSKGIVTVEDKISILGANLKIQSWIITLIITWLIAIAFIRILGMARHESRIRDTIIRLYEEISFSDESMKDEEANPLEYPSILTILTSSKNLKLGKAWLLVSIVAAFMIMLLPFLAVGYAHFILFSLHGPKWWLIASVIAVAGLMIIYTVSFVRSMDL